MATIRRSSCGCRSTRAGDSTTRRGIVDLVKELDPTRLVNNASGWADRGVGDVHDIHRYPGPASAPLEEDRAVVLGEFGGLGLPVDGHTWQQEKNWGYRSFENAEELNDAYVGLLTAAAPADRPRAGRGRLHADDRRRDRGQRPDDLRPRDGEIDVTRAAEAAAKLYLPPPRVEPIVPTSRSRPQTWRFTTTQPADGW